MPSAMATITAMVDRKEWGKALALYQTAPPLSLVLGPFLIIWLMDLLSWRGILTCIGGIAIVTGILFRRFGRCGEFPGDPPRPVLIKELISLRSFWIMVIMFALAMCGTIGIYSMLPLFLVSERGFDADQAGTLLGLSRIAGLFMPFVAGWFVSRVGEKPFIFSIMILSGLSTIMLGIFSGTALICVVYIPARYFRLLFYSRICRTCTYSSALSSKYRYFIYHTGRFPDWRRNFPGGSGVHGAGLFLWTGNLDNRRSHDSFQSSGVFT